VVEQLGGRRRLGDRRVHRAARVRSRTITGRQPSGSITSASFDRVGSRVPFGHRVSGDRLMPHRAASSSWVQVWRSLKYWSRSPTAGNLAGSGSTRPRPRPSLGPGTALS
jgi:hypothetical protein